MNDKQYISDIIDDLYIKLGGKYKKKDIKEILKVLFSESIPSLLSKKDEIQIIKFGSIHKRKILSEKTITNPKNKKDYSIKNIKYITFKQSHYLKNYINKDHNPQE